jgi:hypothetical protein
MYMEGWFGRHVTHDGNHRSMVLAKIRILSHPQELNFQLVARNGQTRKTSPKDTLSWRKVLLTTSGMLWCDLQRSGTCGNFILVTIVCL